MYPSRISVSDAIMNKIPTIMYFMSITIASFNPQTYIQNDEIDNIGIYLGFSTHAFIPIDSGGDIEC